MSQIKEWLKVIGWQDFTIEVASSDASFRSYYRMFSGGKSYIVMDSSKQKESLIPFVDMQRRLCSVGVSVPDILNIDMDLGYAVLEDFGSIHLWDKLGDESNEAYYKKAIDEIIHMQKADINGLLPYDKEFLLFEMNLMEEWYLAKHLGVHLGNEQKSELANVLEFIVSEVTAQPNGIFVHRDFHSRNIMIKDDETLGVIDFQDARSGAVTYDLVSLLKDCYYEIDEVKRNNLVLYFRDQKDLNVDDGTMLRWFDMMGLQRHIKVLGIFARLSHRDGKDGYLADIPLTLKYVLETVVKYPQTKPLLEILK